MRFKFLFPRKCERRNQSFVFTLRVVLPAFWSFWCYLHNTYFQQLEWEGYCPQPKETHILSLSPVQIFSQANTPLKRWLLNFAAKRKGAEVSSGIIRSDSIWDKIFFSKIQVNSISSPWAKSATLKTTHADFQFLWIRNGLVFFVMFYTLLTKFREMMQWSY